VGNIVGLTRQAIVNDNEMEVFSGLATDLGRAAKLTIEVDVYALLNSNPNMGDGYALFPLITPTLPRAVRRRA
jgi:phage major head subunit gpT-like protein